MKNYPHEEEEKEEKKKKKTGLESLRKEVYIYSVTPNISLMTKELSLEQNSSSWSKK